MLIGDSVDNIQNHNEINHNERGNPHPQYNKFLNYKTGISTNASNLYVKLLDITVQETPLLMTKLYEQFAGGFIFKFNYVSAYTSIRPYDFGSVNIVAQFNGSGTFAPFISTSSEGNNGSKIDFFLYTKENTSNITTKEYNIKLYAKMPNSYMSLAIYPIMFETISFSQNKYNAFYDSVCNSKERFSKLFENLSTESFISLTQFNTDNTGFTFCTNYSPSVINSYTYLGGGVTTIDVTNLTFLKLGATSAGQTLNTLTGGKVGQTLTLESYNERTTLASVIWNEGSPTANALVLKNEKATIIPRGQTLTLKYVSEGCWEEIARSYEAKNTLVYTTNTSVDVNEVSTINLAATSAKTLSTLTNGSSNQQITFIATTINNTLTSGIINGGSPTANSIVLKGETNVTLAIGNTITVKYMLGAWIEIGRNF